MSTAERGGGIRNDEPDREDYRWTASLTLPPNETSPRAARALLRLVLAEWNVSGPDAADLLLTEVVTNAVVHARTEMTVRLLASSQHLRVEVQDCSPRLPQQRRPTGRSEHGRGLLLLERLSDQWGYTEHEARTPQQACKTVWFELSEDGLDNDSHDESALHAAFDIDAIEDL